MHHLICGISSLLHSVNLILFTVLLVHLILSISPHHSHHLRSHHLSLPQSFTPDLKSISSQILSSIVFLIPSELPSRILNLYWTKWTLAFVCFSFFFLYIFLIKLITLSFWVHVKLCYRIVFWYVVKTAGWTGTFRDLYMTRGHWRHKATQTYIID